MALPHTQRSDPPLIWLARNAYHCALLERGVLSISEVGVPSNADPSCARSRVIALAMFQSIQAEAMKGQQLTRQFSGNRFDQITRWFIGQTFLALNDLRPGTWNINPRARTHEPDEWVRKLIEIRELAEGPPHLSAVLGSEYVIWPDIVIVREPEPDDIINAGQALVDNSVATKCPLRRREKEQRTILHASISCKWTLRSSCAQKVRSEAVNLMRLREGRIPHCVVVTGEPLPSRLASLAYGTGDIDRVYHFALHELMAAVAEHDEAQTLVSDLVEGGRLRDISDLPFDLAV